MPVYQSYKELDTYRLGEKIDTAVVRLAIQDRLLIQQMGGLFPERGNDFQGFSRVLDIGSGSGFWAVQVAREYPKVEVIGLESPRKLVCYASGQAEAQGIENISFSLLPREITNLPFPDNYFDLINARFLFSLLHLEEWPTFVEECLRVTRPGGYLRFTEPEWGVTSSPALGQLGNLFLRGLKKLGLSPSVDDRHIGVMQKLTVCLEHAGATEVTRRSSVSNYYIEPQKPSNPALRVALIDQMLSPVILNQHLATQEEIGQLLEQATEEVIHENFCEISFLLSACGRKPAAH